MESPSPHNNHEGELAGVRQAAVKVVTKLVEAGHEAYFAGGCVRDQLMGIAPTDYDVATDARPEQVKELFRNVQTVGESFGVMLVRSGKHMIQVATFRTEGVYSDGRHPDHVTFTDAQHDATRRDFTINGLFENPLTGEIIDFVGGRADIEGRIIRAIGNPHDRLREDRLRMLRAVRFASRFGFAIEADTADAIRRSAEELRGVSRERVGQELRRMLCDPNRAVAAWELQYLGLDHAVLLEQHQVVAPTRLGRLPDHAPYATALGAWLLDRHEVGGREVVDLQKVAKRWSDALVLSNAEQRDLSLCIGVYEVFAETWPSLGVAKQKRLSALPEFDQGLLLLQATDRQAFVDVRRRVIDLAQTGLNPARLIDGDDLIAMGLSPGPLFSRVLEAVYDAQLEGSVATKDQAIAMARAVASAERQQN